LNAFNDVFLGYEKALDFICNYDHVRICGTVLYKTARLS
jgi:hypothetical protein